MSDILDRLGNNPNPLCQDAADEIIRLRAQVREHVAAVEKLGTIINNGFPTPWKYLQLWWARKFAQ